jgi:DNA-binding response OmpR family regulator
MVTNSGGPRYPEGNARMPARIVVVHDDRDFIEATAMALRAAGYDVAAFLDPMAAHIALDAAQNVEVLITCVEFPVGKSNGVSLALMARARCPGIKVLFAALAEYRADTTGLGEFLPMPVAPADIVATVDVMLRRSGSQRDSVG